MSTVARTHTPDRINSPTSRTITVQRACNGCGTLLGDVTNDEINRAVAGQPPADVRSECDHCRPLVELEAQGCKTWQLTPRSYARIDHQLDRLDVFTKQFTKSIDGKITTVGMRIGEKPGHVIAYFDDTIIRHPNGHFTIHKAPQSPAAA